MKRKKWDDDWLIFSKKSRTFSFFALGVFLVIVLVKNIYLIAPVAEMNSYDYKTTLNYAKNPNQKSLNFESAKTKREKTKKIDKWNIPSNSFDPNSYTIEDWKQIGFTEKQANTILNFSAKKGGFQYKEDINQLFVVSDELYERLKDVIDLPSKQNKIISDNQVHQEQLINVADETTLEKAIEINKATAKDLESIKGVGPFFSEQIITYRNDLGGFSDLHQLKEVYKISEDKFLEISPFITVNKNLVVPIDLNVASLEDLKTHPYIEWNVAKSIIDLRKQLGDFDSVDQLLMSPHIDVAWLRKMKLYIEVNNN